MFAHTHRQYIAAGPVQDPVGSGTHEQGQAIAPVASHHDQVSPQLFGGGVNFNFGTAEYDMLVLFIDVVGFCKTLQLLGCLLMDFILDSGKIHGDITAVSKAEGLYNVDEMQFCAVVADDGCRGTE